MLTLALAGAGAAAATCTPLVGDAQVSGASECLLMRRYGSLTPSTMVVWLHGNVSTGGPANAHFRLAQETALGLAGQQLLSVALVRPGYPDGSGAFSSGNDNGRADNWQRSTIAEIAAAIDHLKRHFGPSKVILVGHSGGAAIAAVLLGMQPSLVQGAVLVGCPCDMMAWRADRSGRRWSSEDPMRWSEAVPSSTHVRALTGSLDDTTVSALAQAYVRALRQRGVDANFQVIPNAGHIDSVRSPAVLQAISELLAMAP